MNNPLKWGKTMPDIRRFRGLGQDGTFELPPPEISCTKQGEEIMRPGRGKRVAREQEKQDGKDSTYRD